MVGTLLLRRLRERIVQRQNSGVFRHIPLDTKGKLYASPMPYGAYDPGTRLLKIYKKCHVDHVIMVITDEELHKKARGDLRKLYRNSDISYAQFRIKDFQAPTYAIIDELVNDAVCRLPSQNIAVHCHAGVGRTAIAICCIVKTVKNCSAEEAIEYAKKHMDVNMTSEQIRVINTFVRSSACDSNNKNTKDRAN